MIHRFRVILGDYCLMEQMEAVLSGWARQDLRAVQRRSSSASGGRAISSQNPSAFKRRALSRRSERGFGDGSIATRSSSGVAFSGFD